MQHVFQGFCVFYRSIASVVKVSITETGKEKSCSEAQSLGFFWQFHDFILFPRRCCRVTVGLTCWHSGGCFNEVLFVVNYFAPKAQWAKTRYHKCDMFWLGGRQKRSKYAGQGKLGPGRTEAAEAVLVFRLCNGEPRRHGCQPVLFIIILSILWRSVLLVY